MVLNQWYIYDCSNVCNIPIRAFIYTKNKKIVHMKHNTLDKNYIHEFHFNQNYKAYCSIMNIIDNKPCSSD